MFSRRKEKKEHNKQRKEGRFSPPLKKKGKRHSYMYHTIANQKSSPKKTTTLVGLFAGYDLVERTPAPSRLGLANYVAHHLCRLLLFF